MPGAEDTTETNRRVVREAKVKRYKMFYKHELTSINQARKAAGLKLLEPEDKPKRRVKRS